MELKPTITWLPFLLGLLTVVPAPVRAAAAAESDAERRIQDEFRLGEADWKRSCAKPSEDGACVWVTRRRRAGDLRPDGRAGDYRR